MYFNQSLEQLIAKFEGKAPEIVFEWNDSETEAKGWCVINSLRGGAAGGGTRMRKGLDRHEVVSLAKTMEVKFSVCGPAIGGGKSGINFDPADPRKNDVLKRWYKAMMPLLKNYYGTGGDLNVDEVHDVIPITSSYGLLHPQEGVVNGHLQVNESEKGKRIENLEKGVVKIIHDTRFTPAAGKYSVADLITGWGVAEAVRHYYAMWGGDIRNKTAIIQGWGNVGAAAAWYLASYGVKVVGIIDRAGGLIESDGFSLDEVTKMFLEKKGNSLEAKNLLSFEDVNDKIWGLGAEIFIPAAASRLVTHNQLDTMIDGGLEVISSGANVPFADEQIFFGPTAAFADSNCSVIPDFIANCGMARVFAYLMSENPDLSDEGIFSDASDIIRKALFKTHSFNPKQTGIYQKSLELSLVNLV